MLAGRDRARTCSRTRWVVVPATLCLLVGFPRETVGAASLRGAIATPVAQEGVRVTIRGTLGESAVGIARGGSILIRSGFHRSMPDTRGPTWTLGAFPNPYLDEFIDLVLVADERLAEGSVIVEVDGTVAMPVRLTGTAEAWWVDNALSGPVAEATLSACGTDRSGNVGCFVSELAARVIEAHAGGRVVLPGDSGRILIDPGALTSNAWIIAAMLGDDVVQVFGPEALPMRLEQDVRRAADDIDDVTSLHWIGPDGALDSWFDVASARIVARGSRPGLYRVAVGAPGSSRRVEAPPGPAFAAAPNPFEARTTIAFNLAMPGPVRLDILDVAGRLVARLVESELPAGPHALAWEGATRTGGAAPAGIYFVRMTTRDRDHVTKVVRLR